LLLRVCLAIACVTISCRRAPERAPVEPARPQVSGSLSVPGLSAPVRIVRDTWGVPHIYARTGQDLFFAQGLVQAQDRLFQMDLWRRSARGRLSEVLGPNFIERDAMTRRMQYHGDLRAEWDSYGADTEEIAAAFVRGVNAWIDQLGDRLPEEFALAGWKPERWNAEDLLNRTDAFVSSVNAGDEVFQAQLVTSLGLERAGALLSPSILDRPAGLDLGAVTYVIEDALREVGAAPVFSGLSAPVPQAGQQRAERTRAGSNAWAIAGRRTAAGSALLAADPHTPLAHPSLRYLVHLNAPGWNVIGAATPWRPGVVIGHNESIAWAMTSRADDVQDLYAEKVNPADPHQVEESGSWTPTAIVADPIVVKRREKPFAFDREFTSHGVVIAADRQHHLVFTVRWSGFEPGTAPELGALALDRAHSADELRAGLRHWKLPAATFVYATSSGDIGLEAAGLVPVRRGWNGTLPVPGWTGRYEWQGFAAPRTAASSARGYVVSANESVARRQRIEDVLSASATLDIADLQRLQHDTSAWNAQLLVPLLGSVRSDRPDVEDARVRLLAWDRQIDPGSAEATLYVAWERSLLERLARARLDSGLAADFTARQAARLVPILLKPSSVWFDGNPARARDVLLLSALAAVVDAPNIRRDGRLPPWGALHTALFRHPLSVGAAAAARFDVGPFSRGGYGETVMATGGFDWEERIGATFSLIADAGAWDRSVATNAPGQSGTPSSPHFSDLAKLWAAGEYFPLPFSDRAIADHAEATLVLVPAR
jgi:penicillin amidase